MPATCRLCGHPPATQEHHLYPQEFQDHPLWEEKTIMVCEDCHEKIHEEFSNEELFARYYSKEKLHETNRIALVSPLR